MYSGYKKQGKMPNPQDCRSYYAGYNKVEFLIKQSQHMREIWFYVMSGGVMLKIVVMEIARIIIQMF